MALNRLKFFVLILLVAPLSNLAMAQVNIFGVGGYGNSTQEFTSVDASTKETPFGFSVGVELANFPNRSLKMGIDHTRSLQLSPFSSGLSFSVITMKYYLFGPGPESPAHTGPALFATYGFKPFLFTGIGIFQGVAAGATSTGFAWGGGAGMDWSLYPSFFLRFEGRYLSGKSDATARHFGGSFGIGFCL